MMMMMMGAFSTGDFGISPSPVKGGEVDITPLIKIAGNRDMAIFKKFFNYEKIADVVKHHWRDVSLKSHDVTLTANITNVATSLVTNNGTLTPKSINIGSTMFQIGNEYLVPTAMTAQTTTTATYTVLRGQYGTTAVAQTANSSIKLQDKPIPQVFDFVARELTTPYVEWNSSQTFYTSTEMADIARKIKYAGGYNDPKKQIDFLIDDIRMKMQRAILYGIRSLDEGVEDQRLMGGIGYYLNLYGKEQPPVGGAITRALLDREIQRYVDDQGDMKELTLICNMTQLPKLFDIYKLPFAQSGGMDITDKTYNQEVKRIEYGEGYGFNVMGASSSVVDKGDMFFVDASLIKAGFAHDNGFTVKTHKPHGTYEQYSVTTNATLEMHNVREVGSKLTGLTW